MGRVNGMTIKEVQDYVRTSLLTPHGLGKRHDDLPDNFETILRHENLHQFTH